MNTKRKTFTVRYYQLRYKTPTQERTTAHLRQKLESIAGLSENSLSIDCLGTMVDIHNTGVIQKNDGLLVGTLVATQMDDIPPLHNTRTRREEGLKNMTSNDQGIGRIASFVIDPSCQIIALESKKGIVSIKNMVAWLSNNLNLDDVEDCFVVLPDAFERLRKLDTLVKIDVAIAKPVLDPINDVPEDNQLLSGIKKESERMNFDKVRLVLQTDSLLNRGKNRRSLNMASARAFLRRLVSQGNRPVGVLESAECFGYDEHGTKHFIDLIEDKLVDEITVPYPDDRFIQRFPVEEHHTQLLHSYIARMALLRRMYLKSDG